MPLTQQHVDKLKILYEKQYGEKMSDTEAWAMAHRLIALYTLLLGANHENGRVKDLR